MVEEIRRFRHALQDGVAERVVPTPHGAGLFCDSIPIVYDVNFVRADALAPAATLAAEADAAMERFFHRRVITEAAGGGLAGEFATLGWTQSTHVVMAHRREPDRLVDTSGVREVPLELLEAAHTAVTLAEPSGDLKLAEQLFAAKRRVAAAVPTQYFAAYAGGEIAAYCELRSDGRLAQIEDVNTLAAHRGGGLGRLIVQHALDVARGRSEQVFIEALADDWPKELYAKLGFDPVDERHLYLRPPHPLTRLRVRTPRLELRLATIAELRELTRVAEAGVHDPSFMPFSTAWTDAFDDDSVIDWHTSALRTWHPDNWRLELVAFLDGHPIGVQGVNSEHFATTRTATTGSWLGRSRQGQGLGTEMRAAVLTLLFDGLGAETAESGALVGNDRSLAVSRKLGYAEVGMSTVSPRGEPIPHHDLRLTPATFRRPDTPVEIVGLDGLLPLFGVEEP